MYQFRKKRWTEMSASDIMNEPADSCRSIINWLQNNRRKGWAIALKTETSINPYRELVRHLSLDSEEPFPEIMLKFLLTADPETRRGFDPLSYKTFVIGESPDLKIFPCGHIFCVGTGPHTARCPVSPSVPLECPWCQKEYPQSMGVEIGLTK